MNTKPQHPNRAFWGARLAIVLSVLVMTPIAHADLVTTADAAGDTSCVTTRPGGTPSGPDYMSQVVRGETPWTRETVVDSKTGHAIPGVYKVFDVAFSSKTTQTLASPSSDGSDPLQGGQATLQDCSAGTCAVTVHVYQESTSTVKEGVGVLGFLPWFFAVGGYSEVHEEISTTEESKISCEGSQLTSLDFSGGPGPQTAAASIQESNTRQQHGSCSYLNVPFNDRCSIVFGPSDFSVKASTPGRYTRFDVINGGKYKMATTVAAADTTLAVTCTPSLGVHVSSLGIHKNNVVPSVCLDPAGDWRVNFASIKIDVDTTEATNMLAGMAAPGGCVAGACVL